MTDCENRLRAALHFLDKARDDALTEEEDGWYTQASVIFAAAAFENLVYDYGERKTGKPFKQQKLELNDFKRILGSQTKFTTG